MVISWSKRLLYEIRVLIREHADKYQHELTIGQVELLGTALREMGGSIADTAALANRLAGTSTDSEEEALDVEQALPDPGAVRIDLHDLLLRHTEAKPRRGLHSRWRPRVVDGKSPELSE